MAGHVNYLESGYQSQGSEFSLRATAQAQSACTIDCPFRELFKDFLISMDLRIICLKDHFFQFRVCVIHMGKHKIRKSNFTHIYYILGKKKSKYAI